MKPPFRFICTPLVVNEYVGIFILLPEKSPDFGIGDISEDHMHEVCDLYGIARVIEDIDDYGIIIVVLQIQCGIHKIIINK